MASKIYVNFKLNGVIESNKDSGSLRMIGWNSGQGEAFRRAEDERRLDCS